MKKLLSIITAIAILMSALPTVFAAESELSGNIEYVFSLNAYADESGNPVTSGGSNADVLTTTQKAMYTGYNAWSAEGFSFTQSLQLSKDGYLFWNSTTGRVSGEDQADVYLAAAIVLEVTERGTFVPALEYIPKTSAPIYNVYFAKKQPDENLSDTHEDNVSGWRKNKTNTNLVSYIGNRCSSANHLGRVDMYGTADSGKAELNSVNITETGEYYLILVDDGVNKDWTAGGNDSNRAETYLTSFTLTPAETQEDVVSAYALDGSEEASHSASVIPTFAATDGNTITASVSATDEDSDGVYAVTASEADETGEYKFLYWIKGLTSDTANKIVSLTATIQEYKPQNGNNFLIAVYEKADSETSKEPEFYNGNGQLLSDLTLGENGELPELPSMAGYGNAKEWKKHNDSIYVAQYNDFTVKVNGSDVKYGDSVTFTAEDDTDESYFKWWTRTVNGVTEIVSVDREYTFCPWEDCTVEAVYGDTKQIMGGNLRKIVLDILGNDSIMAEFIGLDGADVVEKGIILTNTEGEKKIAMSTNNSQFTITNNISATKATGYAIIKDGTAFTEITDGTITLD